MTSCFDCSSMATSQNTMNVRSCMVFGQRSHENVSFIEGVGMLQKRRRRPLRKKKQRPLFSTNQIQTMENEFTKCRYVTESRRAELAVDLNLTETQVKTWFQNRRTKWKKEKRDKGELPSPEAQSHCEGAIGHTLSEGDVSYYNQQFHLSPIAWNAPNSSNRPSLKGVFSW